MHRCPGVAGSHDQGDAGGDGGLLADELDSLAAFAGGDETAVDVAGEVAVALDEVVPVAGAEPDGCHSSQVKRRSSSASPPGDPR